MRPYNEEGMTVRDVGSGPGFFAIDMAHLVGASGRVIALDLQEGMLQRLNTKIQGTDLEARFTLQKCEADQLGVSEPVDFILSPAVSAVTQHANKSRFTDRKSN